MRYFKRFLSIFLILISIGYGSTYFEWKYFCDLNNGNITVSLNEWNQKCFWYLNAFDTSLSQLQQDISQAKSFIDAGSDTEYRSSLVDSLTQEKTKLEVLQSQLLIAISDFEGALFNQIKSLLVFYLAEQRESVLGNVDRLRWHLITARVAGNELQYKQLLNNMEILQYKLFLLDRIQFAHDFEELIPFLKEYLYGSWKSQWDYFVAPTL